MSFLNPVNEPVLRFSSTDAGAPQINYNARVAGDVKAVLKACLVTGYGTKASAGWSIANEVDHVAEFVSPSVAMSDFKLQVNDSSTTSTAIKYVYEASAVEITSNSKTSAYISSGVSDGWHIFATDSSFIFVEIVDSKPLLKPIGRITCYGLVKSALKTNAGNSFMAWAAGWGAYRDRPHWVFVPSYSSARHIKIGDYTSSNQMMTANQTIIANENVKTSALSSVDLWSQVMLTDGKFVMAELSGLLFGLVAADDSRYDVADKDIGGQSYFTFFLSSAESASSRIEYYGFNCAINVNAWGV